MRDDREAIGSLAMRSGVLFAAMLAASSVAAEEAPLTIGQLLGQGWEIAGYASGYDNRTSLILFRKPGINALVQCSALYDVTRSPRTRRELLRAAVRRSTGKLTQQGKVLDSSSWTPSSDITTGETLQGRHYGSDQAHKNFSSPHPRPHDHDATAAWRASQ